LDCRFLVAAAPVSAYLGKDSVCEFAETPDLEAVKTCEPSHANFLANSSESVSYIYFEFVFFDIGPFLMLSVL